MNTVHCPCCGHDTRIPTHRHGYRWLPGQLRLAIHWAAAGVPHKVIARAFGTTGDAIKEMIRLSRKGPEASVLWSEVDWRRSPIEAQERP